MKAELFEVKTGENKGLYLKVDNSIPKDIQFKLLHDYLEAGYINAMNVNFYRRHKACNNETLQSMDTFDQLSTIWRLNPYGIGNEQTLDFKGEKISEVIEIINS